MTDLSYTAWDDNQYPWPPPDGWYQAADGKWWPEGYGPPAEATGDDSGDGAADDVSSGGVSPDDVPASDPSASDASADDLSMSDPSVEFDTTSASDHDRATLGGSDAADLAEAEVSGPGHSDHAGFEPAPASSDFTSSDYASSGAEAGALSDTGSSPSSDYSSSGYASSGYPAQSDSSSTGLAGWAQSGRAAVADDVSVDDGAPEEVSEDRSLDVSNGHEYEAVQPVDLVDTATSEVGIDPDTTVDSALSRLDDLQRQVESQEFGLGSTAAGAAAVAGGVAGMADSTVGEASDAVSDTVSDTMTEVVESPHDTVSDVMPGDLVEPELFDTASGPVTEAMSGMVADSAGNVVDPTETLDIDPDELSLDVNPYYGQPDAGYPGQNGFETAMGSAAPGFAPVQGTHADQQVGVADDYRPPTADYGTTVLTPSSTPPPKGGGKRLLYVVLGLLALAAAGFAGYVLFQLQGDGGGDTSVADGGAETADAGATGGIGSYTNPHQPDKGVRITVPVGETQDHDWMLEVRELGTTADLGGGDLELMATLRIRNDTPTESLSLDNLRFNLVTSDGGDAIEQSDSCTAGGELDRGTTVEPGKTIAGTVCWKVPADQVGTALMAVQSTTASGRVHVRIT